ncbi:hypothetical protein KNU44_gp034 [Mycobacterium phage CicholasNage]|uniref:Uncharacterized protein n=1 Tax=Mycobacterium phage CicholasNage TaxID=2500799 RepID=A0A411BPI8_9CAUD|nr:hypothetical protein KNU44_gp034 [Mycobacterium phage CicholasNage]AEZ50817.1 hypothetical protein [Mycobacterium phage Fezzik]QAY03545.1 hypothetical protein SEA_CICHOLASNAGE_34 [Mycobacterium phage CicholasNage]
MRIRWPLCETCGHGRICHSPDRGVGWRCHYRGRKRKAPRCGCMRYRGNPEVDGVSVDISELRRLMSYTASTQPHLKGYESDG